MIKDRTTYLRLPPAVRRMARLAAAAADKTLSQYIADLIRTDAERKGIDALVPGGQVEVQP